MCYNFDKKKVRSIHGKEHENIDMRDSIWSGICYLFGL